ncbi:hypothetical protein J6590_026711 [Homalodisca vitripennis]|nr:hypothetical protein J6590_026711 [Homalodisca vitripennis]
MRVDSKSRIRKWLERTNTRGKKSGGSEGATKFLFALLNGIAPKAEKASYLSLWVEGKGGATAALSYINFANQAPASSQPIVSSRRKSLDRADLRHDVVLEYLFLLEIHNICLQLWASPFRPNWATDTVLVYLEFLLPLIMYGDLPFQKRSKNQVSRRWKRIDPTYTAAVVMTMTFCLSCRDGDG